MLPRLYRLKKKSDFNRLLKNGINSRYFNESLSIKFIGRIESQENSRFGFLVAKKYFKKATLRNKIRRKLRELIGQKLSLIKSGNDIVLIAKPGIENKKSIEIDKSLKIILEQAMLFKTQTK